MQNPLLVVGPLRTYLRGVQGLARPVLMASSDWKMLFLCRVMNWRTWRLSWCSATKGTDGMLCPADRHSKRQSDRQTGETPHCVYVPT